MQVALAPDACAAAIAVGIILRIYRLDDASMKTGNMAVMEIGDKYNSCLYTRLLYTADSAHLIACGGEKHIR